MTQANICFPWRIAGYPLGSYMEISVTSTVTEGADVSSIKACGQTEKSSYDIITNGCTI